MYSSKNYSEIFACPTHEYRWHGINHGIVPIAMSDIEGFAPAHAMAWKQSGMGGTVTNITPSREYLDDENAFVYLSKTCEKILECGIDVWLYDELGYPSGAAGGRTTLGHPEFVAKGLVYIKKEGNGKCPVTVEREDDLIRLHSAYAVSKNGTVSVEITDGKWLNSLPYAVVHRLAIGENARGKGIGRLCLQWALDSYPNLKIDTHTSNLPMQRLLRSLGFVHCGSIQLADGSHRMAFQHAK
jgi:GNAT superfamily N-acetyltransferase